jgi:hypothetical protein
LSGSDSEADGALERHAQLKTEILGILSGLGDLLHSNRALCRELFAKLDAECFNLVAVGEFKRGKSSLINALLGEGLLPTGVTPLTSVGVTIRHGAEFQATVHFLDGTDRVVRREQIAEYVTETHNPGNRLGVRDVAIQWQAPLLRNGLQLLDTPGIGSIHGHNTETAYTILPRCDAALFVLSADQPLGRAELDFLGEVRRYAQRIFFVLNKIDYLESDAELHECVEFTRGALTAALGVPVRLFPISARGALKAAALPKSAMREDSGFPALLRELEAFLVHEKGKLVLLGAVISCERLVFASRLELEIAKKALAAPPAELKEKLESFRAERARSTVDRGRLARDFEIRVECLVETCLDPELPQWQTNLQERLRHRFEIFVSERGQTLQPPVLDEALSAFVADELAAAIAPLYSEAEQRLNAEFARVTRVFSAGIGVLVSDLQEFAAGLFQLHEKAPSGDSDWMPESRRRPSLEYDPGALEMLSEMAVKDWPVWLAKRFTKIEAALINWSKRRVIARRRRELWDAIDLNLGRLRYDLLVRLESACADYRAEAFAWFDNSAAGIELALEAGLAERTRHADFREWRGRTLDRQLSQLELYRTRLTQIRETIAGL